MQPAQCVRFRDVFVFVCAARTRENNSANIMRVRVLALKLLTESGEPVCFLIKLHTELQVERQHEKKRTKPKDGFGRFRQSKRKCRFCYLSYLNRPPVGYAHR